MFGDYIFPVRVAVLLLVVPVLTGCAGMHDTLYRGYSVDPLLPESPSEIASLTQITMFKKALTKEGVVSENCVSDLGCTLSEKSAVVVGLMAASDRQCNEHVKSIFGNDAAYNLGFGTATNLFAGAATVAGSIGAKTLFSSIALFSNAERSLVNEVVYKTMLGTAITTKIKESRLATKQHIWARLEDSSAEYPLDIAIHDVVDYHYQCSFMNGLELALKEGTQKTSTQNRIDSLNKSLVLLKMHLDNRHAELKKDQNADHIIQTDPFYSSIKNQIDAIGKELVKLELSNN